MYDTIIYHLPFLDSSFEKFHSKLLLLFGFHNVEKPKLSVYKKIPVMLIPENIRNEICILALLER